MPAPRISLRIPNSVIALQSGASETFKQSVEVSLKDIKKKSVELAEKVTPVGATEELVQSIKVFPSVKPFSFYIFWRAPHARGVESGFAPFYAPIEPLKVWTQVILKDNDPRLPYKIRRKIAKKGIKGHFFLGKARKLIADYAVPAFKADMALLARLLSGNL